MRREHERSEGAAERSHSARPRRRTAANDQPGREGRLTRGVLRPPFQKTEFANIMAGATGNIPDEVVEQVGQEDRENR
jgi:hypothetical protein